MCPFELDLITLLVSDLDRSQQFYRRQLALTECGEGQLPRALALKLGHSQLEASRWYGMVGSNGGPRLRLIESTARAPRSSHGWGSLRFVNPTEYRVVSDQASRPIVDPDGHLIRVPDQHDGASSISAIALSSHDPVGAASFYAGLLGAERRVADSGIVLVLGANTGIELQAKPTLTEARPLAVRFCRRAAHHEAIPELTDAARCLSGAQDELIELI